MVVFSDGKPNKDAYRLFRIRDVSGPDDYATMHEVLRRRFTGSAASAPTPDLLIVDGGKGQLNIAHTVVDDLGLANQFDIIGIAKKDPERGETEDRIYKYGRANPINFGREGDLLLFIQHIRDEAHRSAISYHRKKRGKRAIRSSLDLIPGIGKKRKTALIKHFKTIKRIRGATVEELSAVPGIHQKLAESIRESLQESSSP
jgi:excinuclease ABC subunit C